MSNLQFGTEVAGSNAAAGQDPSSLETAQFARKLTSF